MRKMCFLLGLISILFVVSCKKDDVIDDNQDDNVVYKNYYPMSVGNYWIYKNFSIDTNGVENEMSAIDSIYIKKDTIIRGETYYVFYSSNHASNEGHEIGIYRDSLNYIIDNKGDISFSGELNQSNIEFVVEVLDNGDTLYTGILNSKDIVSMLDVPVGSFDCMENQYEWNIYVNPDIPNPRYASQFYAENIGKVKYQYFYSSGYNTFEKRLLRYYVED